MSITHPELVVALVKPGAEIAGGITPQEADLWHGATGVAGETAEILEAIVVPVIKDEPIDQENMVEELGDMEFYLEQVRTNPLLTIDRAETLFLLRADPPLRLAEESALLAIAGGAVLDQAKKVAIYKKAADRNAFVLALARIESAMENIRSHIGVTREFTLQQNIAKLSVRYAGLTYTDASAVARADKA